MNKLIRVDLQKQLPLNQIVGQPFPLQGGIKAPGPQLNQA